MPAAATSPSGRKARDQSLAIALYWRLALRTAGLRVAPLMPRAT